MPGRMALGYDRRVVKLVSRTAATWVVGGLLVACGTPHGSQGSAATTSGTRDPETGGVDSSSSTSGSEGEAGSNVDTGAPEPEPGWCGECPRRAPASAPGARASVPLPVVGTRPAHCQPCPTVETPECDSFTEGCASEAKCSPWANDGGPAWNSSRCSPVHVEPDVVGEACVVEGSAVSGLDSCALGSTCWGVDPVSGQGHCVAHCAGTPSQPLCDSSDDVCFISNAQAVSLCLPKCDPLEADCDEGSLCVPSRQDHWACLPQATPIYPRLRVCEFANGCSVGTVCIESLAFVECPGAYGCCAAVCPAGDDTPCEPGSHCETWFARGEAPAGLEDVGVCVVDGYVAAQWPPPARDVVASVDR